MRKHETQSHRELVFPLSVNSTLSYVLNSLNYREDVLAELLDNILSDGSADHAESALVNGMDVLLSLIEFKRPK